MTHFVKSGSSYSITNSSNLDIHSKLPVGTYVVLFDERRGYYLDQTGDMSSVEKFYGNLTKYQDRIVHTFLTRTVNTGVLLSGEKGTGKTLLLRAIAHALAKYGIPVILINEEHYGEDFNKFLSLIEQECIISFDEFEKTYSEEAQESVLTILDGVFTSKKLFIFTCNDRYRINEMMMNRPGRIFYHINYRGLEESAIREYCQDNLKNLANMEGVVDISKTINAFNFDMLKGLVEEMNRFNETALESVAMMNIRPDHVKEYTFVVEADERFELKDNVGPMSGSPMIGPTYISWMIRPANTIETEDENDWKYEEYRLSSKNFQKYVGRDMLFVIKEHGVTVRVTPDEEFVFDFNSMAF